MERIYRQLRLGEFEQVAPRLETYLAGLGDYAKNRFEFPDEVIEKVNRNWEFAFKAFDYEQVLPGATALSTAAVNEDRSE